MDRGFKSYGSFVKHGVGKFISYTLLIFLALICFMPFYMMIINSTHSNVEINQAVWVTPGRFLVENYNIILNKVPTFWMGFLNSLIIAVPTVLFTGFFGAMTAYGFSKFKFKLRGPLFWVVLATLMIPQQLGFIGYFQLVSQLGMMNTYWPLILPSIASANFVFFMRGYMDSSIPNELIEAAHVDGAKEWYIFFRIVLPLCIPALATLSIFNFIGSWNNFFGPLMLLQTRETWTLPVLISMIRGLYETNFGAIYLGIAISIVPIMIVFFAGSKYIISGITVGAVKG